MVDMSGISPVIDRWAVKALRYIKLQSLDDTIDVVRRPSSPR